MYPSAHTEASIAAVAPSSPYERLNLIEQRIRETGTVRIDQLASEFGVSEMTIRRDLDELEALGVARRIRGGAVAVGPEPFAERHRHNARAKARIAGKLLDLIPKRGTIAFDASSTVYRLAAALDGAQDLLFDVLVCSAAAVDPTVGSSEASLEEAQVKRALSVTASRVVLAVDHSKLGTRAQARMFALDEVALVVTDLDPDDARLNPYRASVEVR